MGVTEISKYLRDGEKVLQTRADRDIKRNRTDRFTICFRDKGELVSDNIRIKVKLTELDFKFGANIFMLGEYDDNARNRLYESEFCKLFNSATVPLYWEGTEPEKGLLRYDVSSKHDIYRRPPADYVVDFCRQHNLHMKGHVLLWHEFIPKWLPDNYSDIKPLLAKRFREIGERYHNTIEMFDVVNEPSRIFDVSMRDRYSQAKYFVPDDDYISWAFRLAEQYMPANKLILNDTVQASFHEFRGKYSGYYLNIQSLLNRGVPINEIGMQCHLGDKGGENVYNAERLYHVLDTYQTLGKPINISEVSIPSKFEGVIDEDLQAAAAEQLYKIVFSHPAITGITWWNLPDDGILTTKRKAGDENMPSAGLIDKNYKEKKAYQALYRLIHNEWITESIAQINNGVLEFDGFYGIYNIEFERNNQTYKETVKFLKNGSNINCISL